MFKTMDSSLILSHLPHIILNFCDVHFSSSSFTHPLTHSPTVSLLFQLFSSICPRSSSAANIHLLQNICSEQVLLPKLNHKIAKLLEYTFRSICIDYIRVGKRFKHYLDQFMHMTRTAQHSILYYMYISGAMYLFCTRLYFMAMFIWNERKNKQWNGNFLFVFSFFIFFLRFCFLYPNYPSLLPRCFVSLLRFLLYLCSISLPLLPPSHFLSLNTKRIGPENGQSVFKIIAHQKVNQQSKYFSNSNDPKAQTTWAKSIFTVYWCT